MSLFLILVFIAITYTSSAQVIRGGLILGLNMSQVDGDEVAGYKKPGLNVGATAIIPFNYHWSVSIETLLSQQGSFERFPRSLDTVLTIDQLPYYNLRLNYVQVPFMVLYNDDDHITAGAGFAWSRLANGKEIEHGKLIDWDKLGDVRRGPYDRNDLSVLLDVRFRVYQKLHFNFRYQYSMFPIRERMFSNNIESWHRNQYNNLISFRLIYVFNDRVPEKSKKR